MKGSVFKAIYRASDDNWPLLETDKGLFEMRVGGLKTTSETVVLNQRIDLPVEDVVIKIAMSDDFSIYLELENGGCLVYSNTFVNHDGRTEYEVSYLDEQEFKEAKDEWYGLELPIWEIYPF